MSVRRVGGMSIGAAIVSMPAALELGARARKVKCVTYEDHAVHAAVLEDPRGPQCILVRIARSCLDPAHGYAEFVDEDVAH